MFKVLSYTDYDSYIKLINEFRKTSFSYIDFCNFVNNKHIIVILLIENNNIIGSGTILYEQKLIHNYGVVAHIEDVIISKEYRGKKYGKILIDYLIDEAKKNKCYKIILNCDKNVKEFYNKSNFNVSGLEMSYYFEKQ